MFALYDSKPIQRKAVQIKRTGILTHHADRGSWTYTELTGTTNTTTVEFKAHELPLQGGWIVYLNASDTYYCNDQVFRERNVVPT